MPSHWVEGMECKRKWQTLRSIFKHIRKARRSWICNSEHCKQINKNYMDQAFSQHLFTLGADQAKQQLALVRCEISRMFGMQHQAAPVTPVHVSKGQSGKEQPNNKKDEWDEEQRKSTANRVYGPAARWCRDQGSRLLQMLILLCSQGMVQVRAMEMSSIRQKEEKKVEAGRQMREERSTDKVRSRSPRGAGMP